MDEAASGPGSLAGALPPKAAALLLGAAETRRYPDGALVFAKGDAPDGLYFIEQGHYRVTNTNADGQMIQVAIIGPGQWFGEISMFDGLPRTHDGHAAGDLVMRVVPAARFQALLDAHPELARAFAVLLARKLRLAFAALDDQALTALPERLAKQLLSLARDYGVERPEGTEIGLKLTQEELGNMMGVTRVSVSKLLKQWERDGLISLGYGRIVVRDAGRLDRIASP